MENALTYILIIFLTPVISFLFNALLPITFKNIIVYVSLLMFFISLATSIIILHTFYNDANWSFLDWNIFNGLKLIELPIISISDFYIGFGLNFDKLTVFMLLIINIISFSFHLYLFEHISDRIKLSSYYSCLSLFIFSINGIILSNNLFFTFMFWKIAAFSSFLLINFSHYKNLVTNSFRNVFLNSKLSDLTISFGIIMLYFYSETFSFSKLQFAGIDNTLMTISGALIVLGFIYKTIEIIIFFYVPREMNFDISIGNLFYAISMLMPIAYLLIRFFPFLTEQVLHILTLIGAIIAFFGSLIALNQYNLVKIIAYCSISQLGFIICAIGIGSYLAGFIHLIVCTIFTSCLFLSFGPVLKTINENLDIRSISIKKTDAPITFGIILVSSMSICGFPLFLGFLSQNSIVAGAISYYQNFGELTFIIPLLIFISIFITNFYIVRLILLIFFYRKQPTSSCVGLGQYSYYFAIMISLLSIFNFASIFVFPNIDPFNNYGWFYNMMSRIVPYDTLGYDMYTVTNLIFSSSQKGFIFSIIATLSGASLAFIRYFSDSKSFYLKKK